GTATVEGALTIKGLRRPIIATGTYERPVEDPYGLLRAALELRALLDRRDWGMTWQMPLPDGDDVLGWDVEVTVQLELVKQA
ncbi:MAG TPA: YceI family protein, partial [Gaiellales bacterium]|nr:YceI family protein [Gaiellales bacterium]